MNDRYQGGTSGWRDLVRDWRTLMDGLTPHDLQSAVGRLRTQTPP